MVDLLTSKSRKCYYSNILKVKYFHWFTSYLKKISDTQTTHKCPHGKIDQCRVKMNHQRTMVKLFRPSLTKVDYGGSNQIYQYFINIHKEELILLPAQRYAISTTSQGVYWRWNSIRLILSLTSSTASSRIGCYY